MGSTDAAGQLITDLRHVRHDDATRAAQWVAAQVSPGDPGGVAALLRELREAGADGAVRTLAARAAAQVSLGSPRDVAWLLPELRAAGADADALAARAAAQVSLDDPGGIAYLLWALRATGPSDAVTALLDRATQVSLLACPGW